MKKITYTTFIFIFLTIISAYSQTFNGEWTTDYVTADDPNSVPNENFTGYNTIGVTVVEEDAFVAIVNRSSRNSYYLVGYRNASYLEGRLGTFVYQPQEFQTRWVINFDQEDLYNANDATSFGDIVYVANNDTNNHSILAFELRADSIYPHAQRFKTGSDDLWGIDNDADNRMYILKAGDSLNAGSVMIVESPDAVPAWNSTGNSGTVLHEFDLPEVGSVRGITVNSDGSLLYVSNWDNNKVYCFIGDPVNGYTLNEEFNFNVDGNFISPTFESNLQVGPHGLQYMNDKNILFVTHDTDYEAGDGYEYGRIYLVNPNTGEVVDTINVAEWNKNTHEDGQYNDPDSTGHSSGYASVNCVDFDENYNVYSQTYYGWAIDKWLYSEQLPTIEVTIVGIEKIDNIIPEKFELGQNYPNPFNPTTTIEFSVENSDNVSLSIYSVTGELVANLLDNQKFNSGHYKVTFDGSNLSSGTYIYKISNGKNSLSKKMILLK